MRSVAYDKCLDGIRGLAVLLVVISHQTVCLPKSPVEKVWISLLRTGWVGVDLFFVLSGFLITSILLEERESPGYYLNFYARRALRILPLFYLLVFVFTVVVPQLPAAWTRTLEPMDYKTFWFWFFLTNFLIAIRGQSVQPPLAVSWSLSIEEQFYLVWPWLVRKVSLDRLRKICIGGIVVAGLIRIGMGLYGVAPISIYVLPFTRADTIAFGALIAIYRFEDPSFITKLGRIGLKPLLFSALIGVGIAAYPGRDSMWMNAIGYLFVAVAATATVIGTLGGNAFLRKLFSHSFLVAIGKRSYAMYLLHVPVVGLLVTLFFDPNRFPTPALRIAAQSVLHLVSFLFTFLLAYVAYYAVERHFLKLKRFFTTDGGTKLGRSQAAVATGS